MTPFLSSEFFKRVDDLVTLSLEVYWLFYSRKDILGHFFNVVFTLIFTSLKTYKSCLKLKIFFKYGILNYLSEKKIF